METLLKCRKLSVHKLQLQSTSSKLQYSKKKDRIKYIFWVGNAHNDDTNIAIILAACRAVLKGTLVVMTSQPLDNFYKSKIQ